MSKPVPHLAPQDPLDTHSTMPKPIGQTICSVLRLGDTSFDAAAALLARHGLTLQPVAADACIPGTYWGEPEAGIIGTNVYARADTPVHSVLHEACHLIVLPPERRAAVHTNATRSAREEDAVCYLQILLADDLPSVGRERLMSDMDAWGYTFRLGSAKAWFEHDASDARAWLVARDLIPVRKQPATVD